MLSSQFRGIVNGLLILCFSLSAHADAFKAGKEYLILKQCPQASGQPVQVTEFFSYGCPWCYRIEARLNEWIKDNSQHINFSKVPVVFKPSWEAYAKAYYAAEALGLSQTLSPDLFKRIITDKESLGTDEAMITYFSQHGVALDVAKSAFLHSAEVTMQLAKGKQAMAMNQISAIPAVVVNQCYKTNMQMAGSEAQFFAVLDYLLKKSQAG